MELWSCFNKDEKDLWHKSAFKNSKCNDWLLLRCGSGLWAATASPAAAPASAPAIAATALPGAVTPAATAAATPTSSTAFYFINFLLISMPPRSFPLSLIAIATPLQKYFLRKLLCLSCSTQSHH
jgi:septal ring-binding cell division protein DamX